MENSLWILGIIAIVLCALVFYKKIVIKANITGVEISGEDSKQTVDISNSQKIKIDQDGGDQSAKVDKSEDIDIKQQ